MRFRRCAATFAAVALVGAATVSTQVAHAVGDSTTPALISFQLSSPTTLNTDDNVGYSWTANDDDTGVAAVVFDLQGPSGRIYQARSDGALGNHASGVALAPIQGSWIRGSYRLLDIEVLDGANNAVTYHRDSTITHAPADAAVPASSAFDLSQGDFTVGGASGDTSTPVLSSFQLGSPTLASAGDQIRFTWAGTDDITGVASVIFTLQDSSGQNHQVRSDGSFGNAASGNASTTVGSDWPPSSYQLSTIDVFDQAGNRVTYLRFGAITHSPDGASAPSADPFDLSTGDLTVQAAASPSPSGDPNPPPLNKPPTIRESNARGVVSLMLTTAAQYQSDVVYFFRKSGLTGQVVPLGTGIVNAQGIATRSFRSRTGQALALYGKITLATNISSPYSNTITFKVK